MTMHHSVRLGPARPAPPRPAPPCRELWLECARRAFAGLCSNSGGRLRLDAVLSTLRSKLPADEVDYAVEDALVEAGYAGVWVTNDDI